MQHVVYTSGPKATTSRLLLMADHAATEEALAASGLTYTVLRDGWYVENYTGQVDDLPRARHGRRRGRRARSASPRAATTPRPPPSVLTTDGHAGKVYELGGEALTLAEIAALISTETGREITYTDVPVETLTGILAGAGFPEPVAAVFADVDRGIAEGELLVDPTDLATLLGRPATPAATAVKAALAG